MTATTAVADRICEMILMKVPTEFRTEAVIPTVWPYSLRIMPTSVRSPFLRSGTA